MRTLILASLLGGAAAWSTTALYAEPPAADEDSTAAAPADEGGDVASAPADRPADVERPSRDDDRPRGEFRRGRRGPDDERPFRGRGPDGDFGPRGGRGPDGEFGPPPDRDAEFGPPGERRRRGPEGDQEGRPFPPDRGRDGFAGPPFGGPPRDFVPPILHALDADGDRVISADEIAKAADALKTLDKNSDGKLTADELRPDFARRGPDDDIGPPFRGGRGPRFGRGGEGFGTPEGKGPPPDDRRGFGRRGDNGPPPDEFGGGRRSVGPRDEGHGELRRGDGRRHGPPHGDPGPDGAHHRRRHGGDAERGPHRGPPRDDADTAPKSAPQETEEDAPADTQA